MHSNSGSSDDRKQRSKTSEDKDVEVTDGKANDKSKRPREHGNHSPTRSRGHSPSKGQPHREKPASKTDSEDSREPSKKHRRTRSPSPSAPSEERTSKSSDIPSRADYIQKLKETQHTSTELARSFQRLTCKIEDMEFAMIEGKGSFTAITGQQKAIEYLYFPAVVATLAQCCGPRVPGKNMEWKTNGLANSILNYCFPSAMGWTVSSETRTSGGIPDYCLHYTTVNGDFAERIAVVFVEDKKYGESMKKAEEQLDAASKSVPPHHKFAGERAAKTRYRFLFIGDELSIKQDSQDLLHRAHIGRSAKEVVDVCQKIAGEVYESNI